MRNQLSIPYFSKYNDMLSKVIREQCLFNHNEHVDAPPLKPHLLLSAQRMDNEDNDFDIGYGTAIEQCMHLEQHLKNAATAQRIYNRLNNKHVPCICIMSTSASISTTALKVYTANIDDSRKRTCK